MSGLSLFIPAVQILYVSERQHWLTVSYLNDDLQVYDSICGSKFTTSVELQIASIFASASQGDSLVATVVPVQQQLGEVDWVYLQQPLHFMPPREILSEGYSLIRAGCVHISSSALRNRNLKGFHFHLATLINSTEPSWPIVLFVFTARAECQRLLTRRWLPVIPVKSGFITSVWA